MELADQAVEASVLLGAGAAIMNQLAMPGVGDGVVEHSDTLERPLDRLRTTLTYVYVVALGSDEERAAVAQMVNRAHAPVRSPGRYSAFDPELQLWVAATLSQLGEHLQERVFGPLDADVRERLYRQTWAYGTLLQVEPGAWPPTRAAFDAWWDASLGRLGATPEVRVYCRELVAQRGAPAYLRPLRPLQSLMTRGLVPPETRAALDLPWSRRDQWLFDLFWRVFPPAYRLLPRPLRHLPATLYLRDFRRRRRQGRRVI